MNREWLTERLKSVCTEAHCGIVAGVQNKGSGRLQWPSFFAHKNLGHAGKSIIQGLQRNSPILLNKFAQGTFRTCPTSYWMYTRCATIFLWVSFLLKWGTSTERGTNHKGGSISLQKSGTHTCKQHPKPERKEDQYPTPRSFPHPINLWNSQHMFVACFAKTMFYKLISSFLVNPSPFD